MNYWTAPTIKFNGGTNLPHLATNCSPYVIIETVGSYYHLERDEIFLKQRSQRIKEPRQICMYLLNNYTKLTLASIGKLFSKDHTTVIHSVARVKDLLANEKGIQEDIFKLCLLINSKTEQ